MNPSAANAAQQARKRLANGYRLQLHYATLWRFAAKDKTNAGHRVVGLRKRSLIQFYDGDRILASYRDYLVDAKAVPPVELRIQGGIARYRPESTEAQAWVFTMNGRHVGELFQEVGVDLLGKNVRGYLGSKTEVNADIEETLKRAPERFWFFNNGVTILCDSGTLVDETLVVNGAFIVNGGQTTRTLWERGVDAKRADVLVRVIEVGPTSKWASPQFLSNIVKSTNWQNKIDAADLRSNDRLQVELERELLARGYLYVRKREDPRDRASRLAGGAGLKTIKKEELAVALGGTLEPGLPVHGRPPLFREHYGKIFGQPVEMSLACFLFWTQVKSRARGSDERKWAKFVVHYFLWQDLAVEIRKRAGRFIALCETKDDSLLVPLYKLIDSAMVRAVGSYRRHRRAKDSPSKYFRRREEPTVYARLLEEWSLAEHAKARKRFEAARSSFLERLRDSD